MNSTAKYSAPTSVRQDVYSRVTDKIIAELEQGVRPWMKPWSGNNAGECILLPVRHCGTPYRGINILLLWGEAVAKGYASNKWMTFQQARQLGAHVRKGEHGSLVVYANKITKTEENDEGEEVERQIPYMKGYMVFNVEQIDELPEHYYVRPESKGKKMQLIESAEHFFRATGALIQHGGNRAYYAPGPDVIRLPHPEAFKDAESYAATKAHELIHHTGHASRLNREFGKRFGDDAYAREELVAELGAAFLCVALDITPEIRDDHASYLDHWLTILKADRRAIFSAAAHAQRAVDYLISLQPGGTGVGNAGASE
jgi:antirestriction protein ArdC